jgi:hypothetical protein
MPNRIELKGHVEYDEGRASAAIIAGQLIALGAVAGEVAPHASIADFHESAVAIESALWGKTIADPFAIGDLVPYVIGKKGAQLFVFVKAGENIAAGEALVSAGDGTLVSITNASAVSAGIKAVVGYAVEAIDLSGGGAVDTRTPVRIA